MPYADKKDEQARNKRYRASRLEELRANDRAYHAANRDALLPKMRARHERTKDEANAKTRDRRQADPESVREADRLRRAADPERFQQNDKRRYRRDAAKVRARASAYSKANPDKRADAQQRRRARKAGAETEPVMRAEVLARHGPHCAFCGVLTLPPVHRRSTPRDRHYDHAVPLGRGGEHSLANLRILCAACNVTKQDRLDCELVCKVTWAQGKGRYAIHRRSKKAADPVRD